MTATLIEHPKMAEYRFGPHHPLRPERFTLAIALMRGWGLVGPPDAPMQDTEQPPLARAVQPHAATLDELALAHDDGYIDAVMNSAALTLVEAQRWGLGPGDTPVFPGMHDAASLAVGGTIRALNDVIRGAATRSYHPAGGLHHAHRDHASGFCVYNDVVCGIESAIRAHAGLRVAYVDIDAHHGDGVEAAFADRDDVLTVSVHESGAYLFPGSGRLNDSGTGRGAGCALNVPLLPYSGPESYGPVVSDVIVPALRRFGPDVIVLQAGADSHRNDPLTHLHNSVAAFDATVASIVSAADELCGGRIVAVGGGGYDTFSAVPRMWGVVLCRLLGMDAPAELPASWIESARRSAAEAGVEWQPVTGTFDEHVGDQPAQVTEELTRETRATIARLHASHAIFQ